MSKGKKIILLGLLALVMVSLTIYLLLPFLKNIFMRGVSTNEVDSPFSDVVNGSPTAPSPEITTPLSYDLPTSWTPEDTEPSAPEFPITYMKRAMSFLSLNRISDPDSRPVIGENEIVVEVVNMEESTPYKVLATSNMWFGYTPGERIKFKFKIPYSVLIVQKEDGSLARGTEMTDFELPRSLVPGDKIVFECKIQDCTDNELSWALVFKKY